MRGRWLAVGALSVFALGVAAGGVVRRHAAPVPAAPAPVASRCASAVADAGADARKAAATACLLRELPHDFDPSKYPLVGAAVDKCLGKTPVEIAGKGVSKVQFGRDVRNGKALDLVVVCADICPDYTSTAVVYAKPLSQKQCFCLGGAPAWMLGGGFAGCGPGLPPKRGLGFRVGRLPGMRGGLRVIGGFLGTRLIETGIQQGDTLLSADGQPMRSAADAKKVMLRFPFDPPRSVTLEVRHSDKLEIRYVGWDVIQRLSKRIHELKQRFGYPKVCCQSHGHVTGIFRRVTIGLRCHDAATKAWLAFGRSLASVHATPGVPRGPQGFPGCSALRDTPTEFHPLGTSRDVQIKYIG